MTEAMNNSFRQRNTNRLHPLTKEEASPCRPSPACPRLIRVLLAWMLATLIGGVASLSAADPTRAAAAAPVPAASLDSLTDRFRRGLLEEEANRDLGTAIRHYESVISELDAHREMLATAVFRLGECYRKQGLTNQAVQQFERVVRDFSDLRTLVTLSTTSLAALGRSSSAPPRTRMSEPALQEQRKLLEEEIALVERKIATQEKAARNGVLDPAEILKTSRERLRLLRQLSALSDSVESRDERRRSLDEEIQLMQKRLGELQKQVEVGVLSPTETLDMQRELLDLRRQRAALDVEPPAAGDVSDTGNASFSNEAQKEIARLRVLLRDSPDLINAPGPDGETPLASAATRGDLEVMRFLLSQGASAQGTALRQAVLNGHRAAAQLLLDHGADVNSPGNDGTTSLHVAARAGFTNLAQFLLSRGARVDAVDNRGRTALHIAAVSDDGIEMAKLLVANGANLNAQDETDTTPLVAAIQRKGIAMGRFLLDHGADPNIARSSSRLDRSSQFHPLYLALSSGARDLVEPLLRAGANPNAIGRSEGNNLTRPPLAQAIIDGATNAVPIFLKYKADPNIRDQSGSTPVFYATEWPGALQQLIAAGAQLNLTNYSGETPLLRAVNNARTDAAEIMIAAGAQVDLPANVNGTLATPLWAAVARGNRAMVEVLLRHHADPNLRASDSLTPLDLAKTKARDSSGSQAWIQIAELLRRYGAIDDLPRLDRIQVSRPERDYIQTVLDRGTTTGDGCTLFELLAVSSGLLDKPGETTSPPGPGVISGGGPGVVNIPSTSLSFPDFSRVTVRRPAADKKSWVQIPVNVATALTSDDCTMDVPLQWGDVVEVPEADHPLHASWEGLPAEQIAALGKCLSREIEIRIRNQNYRFQLGPVSFRDDMKSTQLPGTSVLLASVLSASQLLTTSSDLSSISVKRRDPKTGETQQWTITTPAELSGFWLREGDVVEIPEKPRSE